jgi:hypothetical protein
MEVAHRTLWQLSTLVVSVTKEQQGSRDAHYGSQRCR